VVSYSPEYSTRPEDPQLLSALAEITGGRNNPNAAAAFDPTAQAVGTVSEIGLPLLWLALLLLPLDIGLRRLHLRLAEFMPRRKARPAPPGYTETLARLSVAKRRATVRAETSPLSVVSSQLQPATDDRRPATDEAPRSTPAKTQNSKLKTQNSDGRPRTTDNGQQTTDEEQYARLLAAKQRARRKREQ
jgi:hypothetical protein